MAKPLPEKVTREWVRENLPTACEVADDFRAVFGAGVTMTYAAENGYELGEKQDESKMIGGADISLPLRLTVPENSRNRRK